MAKINQKSIGKKIQSYAQKIGGTVPIRRLFPPEFVQEHSDFTDIYELLSPAGITDRTSYEDWQDSTADLYIRSNTDFHSWNKMIHAAAREYALMRQKELENGTWKEESIHEENTFDGICFNICIT